MRFLVPFGALGVMSCHVVVEFPWDTGETEVPDPDTSDTSASTTAETGTPTETTGDTGVDTGTGFGHVPVAEDTLCFTCHEADRMTADHYTDGTPPNDCAPCHTTTSWSTGLIVHPVKRPHGAYDDGVLQPEIEWVVACSACHTNAPNYTTFECSSCHNTLFPHAGIAAPGNDQTCIACHPSAEM